MKTTTLHKLIVGVMTMSCLTFAGAAAEEKEKAAKKPSWEIQGELEEACSCAPACPCWFKSLPTRMTCDGMQVVFITAGKYGKTPLKGLALGQFVQSPKGKTMLESVGEWNFDYTYIDEKATEEQRVALQEIASHIFPMAAKKRELRFVPITRTTEGKEHKITVGTIGTCSAHLMEGGAGGAPKVTSPPLSDPTHREFYQGETTLLTYKDAGQGWEYKETNYMFNKFKVNDKDYVKYEAEVAKMMAAMKKDEAKPKTDEPKTDEPKKEDAPKPEEKKKQEQK